MFSKVTHSIIANLTESVLLLNSDELDVVSAASLGDLNSFWGHRDHPTDGDVISVLDRHVAEGLPVLGARGVVLGGGGRGHM